MFRPLAPSPHRPLVRRALVIIALGMALQLPILSARQLVLIGRDDYLAQLFTANILQVIGISMLVVLAIVACAGVGRGARILALSAALVVMIATPHILSSDLHTHLPVVIASYFAPRPESIFPLFPFAAYLLVGFAGGRLIVSAVSAKSGPLQLATLGLVLMIASAVIDLAAAGGTPYTGFWNGSLQQIPFRTGGVVLLLAAGTWCAQHVRSLTHPLQWFGRHSLPAYVVHLMLIYGSPINPGLTTLLQQSSVPLLTPLMTLAAAATATALTAATINAWLRLRSTRPDEAHALHHAFLTLLWVVFLFKP